MSAWNQTTLRNLIHEHFHPSLIQANSSWVNSVSFRIQSDGKMQVLFPHAFFQDWFAQNLQEDFEAFIADHVPVISGFSYHNRQTSTQRPLLCPPFQGDARHTFERFLHNAKNRQQVMTARELIARRQWPGAPLLVYGPSGSGRTHLLLAMANALLEGASGAVLVCSFDDFWGLLRLTGEQKERIRTETARAEAFLLDDVHKLEQSESLQKEFLLLFDQLQDSGVPMFFTGRHHLSGEGGILPKLRSRLEAGIIVHLKKPDLDIRLQFVHQEARRFDLRLSEHHQLTLARRCPDFQALSRALFRLAAHSNLRAPVQEKAVTESIEEARGTDPVPPSCQEIIARVGKYFSLPAEDLTSHHRRRDIVLARQIAILLCRRLHQVSYTQIGALFGGRNHSSIIYSFKKIQALQKDRPDIKAHIQTLLKQCSQQ